MSNVFWTKDRSTSSHLIHHLFTFKLREKVTVWSCWWELTNCLQNSPGEKQIWVCLLTCPLDLKKYTRFFPPRTPCSTSSSTRQCPCLCDSPNSTGELLASLLIAENTHLHEAFSSCDPPLIWLEVGKVKPSLPLFHNKGRESTL